MRCGNVSYQYELLLAAATIFSTTGLLVFSKFFSHKETSFSKDRAKAIASSKASRVPEPIEKCPVLSASPMSTLFSTDQLSFVSSGKLRHTDLLDTSGLPPRSRANTRSQYARLSASLMRSSPARFQVAA